MENQPLAVLHAPSKTFLLGEYLALAGGPSLILNTEPRFTLSVSKADECQLSGINPESPAGKLLRNAGLPAFRFEFLDPHTGKGGLGASSAQFALCYKFLHSRAHADDVLTAYQDCAWSGSGQPPSGADVLSQLFGNKLSLVHEQSVVGIPWPFEKVDFLLVRTGKKVATHEHLAELNLRATDALYDWVDDAWKGLLQKKGELFLDCVRGFRRELEKNGWVAEHTQELLSEIDRWPEVLAAKGCGALGADVLLIAFDSRMRTELEDRTSRLGLENIADSSMLYEMDPLS